MAARHRVDDQISGVGDVECQPTRGRVGEVRLTVRTNGQGELRRVGPQVAREQAPQPGPARNVAIPVGGRVEATGALPLGGGHAFREVSELVRWRGKSGAPQLYFPGLEPVRLRPGHRAGEPNRSASRCPTVSM